MNYLILINIFLLSSFELLAQPVVKIPFGTEVILNDGTNLVLNNLDLENEGVFNALTPNTTVIFSGNSNSDLFSSDDIEFYNLKINKSANATLSLNTDILVENDIDVTAGIFNLDGYLVTLDGGQIVNENQSNYITGSSGRIEYITNLNNPNAVNPGNLGIEITSAQNLGQTVIRRSHLVQESEGGGYGIKRYFDINPVNNAGLSATLRMYYFDHELNGIPESELGFYRSEDNGTTWDWIGFDVLNAAENYLEKTGIDAFSRWTIGSLTTGALPVELETFSALAAEQFNQLEWTTLSEQNVDRFDIQRLNDGNWENIGRVASIGFSNDRQSYGFKDFTFSDLNYYRLRILDFDGQEAFSEIVAVKREKNTEPLVEIYPNPVNTQLNLRLSGDWNNCQIRIFNATGQELFGTIGRMEQIEVSRLPAGAYYLEVRSNTVASLVKFIKQ